MTGYSETSVFCSSLGSISNALDLLTTFVLYPYLESTRSVVFFFKLLLLPSLFLIGDPSLSRIGGLKWLLEEAGGLLLEGDNKALERLLLPVFCLFLLLASGD